MGSSKHQRRQQQKSDLNLSSSMATALSLDHRSAPKESLCEYPLPQLNVNFLCMDEEHDDLEKLQQDSAPPPTSIPRAARLQEIFLDFVGWHASRQSSSRFLLDDRFDTVLSTSERILKEGLLEVLAKKTTAEGGDVPSVAFRKLESILEEHFGYACEKHKKDQVLVERMKTKRSSDNGKSEPVAIPASPHYSDDDHRDPVEEEPSSEDAVLDQISRQVRGHKGLCRIFAYSALDSKDVSAQAAFTAKHRKRFASRLDSALNKATPGALRRFRALFRPAGHVFICNASVCEIACDAFLCPVAFDEKGYCHGRIFSQWRKYLQGHWEGFYSTILDEDTQTIEFTRQKTHDRVAVLDGWPEDCTLPRIFPTEISLSYFLSQRGHEIYVPSVHVRRLMESVQQFLHAAYDICCSNEDERDSRKRPLNRRERHLFAVPVVGTGGGSAGDLTGDIIRNLLTVLKKFTEEFGVDCVLVAADEATYTHAQAMREKPCDLLSATKCQAAEQLAELAATGHLSLFLGAGTSIAAGLPGWFDLLLEIEDQFTPHGSTDERHLGDDCKWDPLKMADELQRIADTSVDRQGNRHSLNHRVATLLNEKRCHPSLVLSLLVSLPSRSIVTTNYDTLIERACLNVSLMAAPSNRPSLSVLPHDPVPCAKRWLLKMHGSVTRPELIVLSGNDYANRKILGGIVQTNLLTTHILFCGFSLTDPNYLRILKEVRDAVHPEEEKKEDDRQEP